jgi:hypothetical protein
MMLTSTEQTISHLQNELHRTRLSVMEMMPFEAQVILTSYHSCKSRQHTRLWPHIAATKIIELATILPPTIFDSSKRAYCPLCGASGSNKYSPGFSVPEGLRRHLLGWSNSSICPMFDIVLRMANEEWDKSFFETEEQERARIQERKKHETLYKAAPKDEPKLLDEGFSLFQRPRTLKELPWAEARLATLGFLTLTEDRVRWYIDERERFVVYADPCEHGQISFRVYAKPVPKRGHTSQISDFRLFDRWKNDIRRKYEARLPRQDERLTLS